MARKKQALNELIIEFCKLNLTPLDFVPLIMALQAKLHKRLTKFELLLSASEYAVNQDISSTR